jgi:hypothetical protein
MFESGERRQRGVGPAFCSRALQRQAKSGPELRHVPALARDGRGQRLASLGIPVVLTFDGLVDRLVVVRHVLRIGAAP